MLPGVLTCTTSDPTLKMNFDFRDYNGSTLTDRASGVVLSTAGTAPATGTTSGGAGYADYSATGRTLRATSGVPGTNLGGTNPVTIVFRMFVPAGKSGLWNTYSLGSSSTNRMRTRVAIKTGSTCPWNRDATQNSSNTYSTFVWNDSSWHTLGLTYDASNKANWYVNGSSIQSTSFSATSSLNTPTFIWVGSDDAGANSTGPGCIGCMRIYAAAKTASDHAAYHTELAAIWS